MGGSIGGPYGAGGGLVLGFLTGLFTADSYYGQLNAQIQTEQQKDRQLEAAIEQELARQRALETQVASASGPSAGAQTQTRATPEPSRGQAPLPQNPNTSPDSGALAALKKNSPPAWFWHPQAIPARMRRGKRSEG